MQQVSGFSYQNFLEFISDVHGTIQATILLPDMFAWSECEQEAALTLGVISSEDFDLWVDPKKMLGPS